MKKILLVLLICYGSLAKAQTENLFVNAEWTANNLTQLKDAVYLHIGNAYTLTKVDTTSRKEGVRYIFANSVQNIVLEAQNEGGKSIYKILVTGTYADLFNIYREMIKPDADMKTIKQKGSAEPITKATASKNVNIAFYKSDGAGNWTIKIVKA